MTDINKILEERGETYNSGADPTPVSNFTCAANLMNVFDYWCKATNQGIPKLLALQLPHDHAIRMLLLKIARIATGAPHKENYDDAIGYTKLAAQLAGFEPMVGRDNVQEVLSDDEKLTKHIATKECLEPLCECHPEVREAIRLVASRLPSRDFYKEHVYKFTREAPPESHQRDAKRVKEGK